MAEKVKENFLRRKAKRLNVRIEKSKGKEWKYDNQLGWRIWDGQNNIVILGEIFNLSLEDVEKYLDGLEKELTEGS